MTTADEFVEAIADAGSFVSWDPPNWKESVITGEMRIRGRRVAMVAGEFSYQAGSIGVATAERLVEAIEKATAARLPLIASPASGGTRMQEGTLAFVQMIKVSAAVAAHRAAHLPYVVYLRSPTMGGVFASWGSLGHITFAEPGALVGFLGPRVYSALYGEEFPEGVQVSENLYRNGVIDGVVPVKVFRHIVHRALIVMTGEAKPTRLASPPTAFGRHSWTSVLATRRPDRPGIRDLLRRATERVPLSGTGQGELDRTVLLSLARFHGQPCVLFGQDRRGGESMGPAALREARRAMKLAEELRIPLVTVIDTVGASLSKEAEESGLAPEIARCIADLVTLETRTLAVLLGQGTGGGALALLPADRVIAAENAWLSPLPPEGASAIVYRDTEHAAELAEQQRIGAGDLYDDGVVDSVISEAGDFIADMVTAIGRELAGLKPVNLKRRVRRYRDLGVKRPAR